MNRATPTIESKPAGRRNFLGELFHRAETASVDDRPPRVSDELQVIVVLLVATVVMTIQEYCLTHAVRLKLAERLDQTPWSEWVDPLWRLLGVDTNARLADLLFWAGGMTATYVVVPTLVIWFVFGQRLRDYGFKIRGVLASSWIYLGMLAILGPLLWQLSATASFQARYPFYQPVTNEPLWPALFVWEIFYLTQFVGLEFFFRGFLLHGTKRRFGYLAIFVMVAPYCMIHFGKPMPETFGAIVAGIALGYMSLKTRSIWLGAAAHITVAISMDMLALCRG